MLRFLSLATLSVAFALQAQFTFAQEPATVGKSGYKVDGEVGPDDPKVKAVLGNDIMLDLSAKMYQVKLVGGKSYSVSMDGKGFDPFLVVQDKDGKQVAQDDDSGGGLNARLLLTPGKDGVVKIFAAALDGQGKFVLKVQEIDSKSDPKKVYAVGEGIEVNAALTPDVRAVVYQVTMEQGKAYQIDLVSSDDKFDAFLVIHNPEGKKVAEDDDGGEKLNSRITFRPETSGTHRIIATSLNMSGRGEFSFTVRLVD